jgi:RimJ/RimL family protein N-acetyltransferase
MAHLDGVTWPPKPVTTDRLVLRVAEARDREAVLDLFSDPRVNSFVGGGEPRDRLDEIMPEVPGQRPGFFVVEQDDQAIGIVTFDPRDAGRPGHVRAEGGEAELGYMFLPHAWGRGYATEACAAAMSWFRAALPEEPLVVSTQLVNVASLRLIAKLGFAEVEHNEEHGAAQWFGAWTPASIEPAGDRTIGPRL